MLQPGDEVVVHAGTYMTPGFYEVTWAGTARQPIVIHAAPGDRRPARHAAQNVINISARTGRYRASRSSAAATACG